MTVEDWATLIVAILTIVSSIAFGIKWLVKHYLVELKPNSGSSLRDAVTRLELALDEQRVDSIKSRNRQLIELINWKELPFNYATNTLK